MVQQSDVLKRFLAGTYSNQILHLSSASESEKTEDFKNLGFPKKIENCNFHHCKPLWVWL